MTPEVDTAPLCVRRTTCRICDSRDLELVLPLAPTPSASHFIRPGMSDEPQPYFQLDVVLCRRCGLVQLADTVDPGYLYAQSWERTSRDSPGMAAHFQRYAEAMRPFKPDTTAPGFVVEIGSNDGCLLRAMAADGWHVGGVDPCAAAAPTHEDAGFYTLPAFFSEQTALTLNRCTTHQPDLVIANNVLANVDDLPDFAEGIRTLLAPNGVFVFETGYLGSLVEHLVFDNIYHEHLSYFSVRPLIQLFADHGLELFHVEEVHTKGGSLRGFVQHVHGPKAHSVESVRFLAREEAQRLACIEPYSKMRVRLARLKQALDNVLRGLSRDGHRIAGYGASLSVITLLHHFDCAQWLPFIVDDNPVKHGWRTPGHRLEVRSPSTLAESDYCVILPWRFADMIIAKNQTYQTGGGRFIVPMPEVRVV